MTNLEPTSIDPSPAAEGVPLDGRPRGGSLLAQISNAMVRIHKEHWGKGPTKARTFYTEDVVLTRLEEIFTKGGAHARARRSRGGGSQHADRLPARVEHEFVGAVERLTRRTVHAFIPEIHAATHMEIELFVLEPAETPADPSAGESRLAVREEPVADNDRRRP